MATATVRSRIVEHFSKDLLKEMKTIIVSGKFANNNQKSKAMTALFDAHEVDYTNLGTGTNRLAILIDGYVFKVALDRWGELDNMNEYTMSRELQPFVTKVYETNSILSVHEYVTLISMDEFLEKKFEIQKILALIAESYLLGDVGTVKKNYCNWGYRDDGQLVILDFAYIYRVTGDIMLCPKCNSLINYDSNFYNLECSNHACRKKFSYMDIKRRISIEDEMKEIETAKKFSFIATKSFDYIKLEDEDDDTSDSKLRRREEKKMDKYEVEKFTNAIDEEMDAEVQEEMFEFALENIDNIMKGKAPLPVAKDLEYSHPVPSHFDDEFDNETDEIDNILFRLKAADNGTPIGYEELDIYTNPEELLDEVSKRLKSLEHIPSKEDDDNSLNVNVEEVLREKMSEPDVVETVVEEITTVAKTVSSNGEKEEEVTHTINVKTKEEYVDKNDFFMGSFDEDDDEEDDDTVTQVPFNPEAYKLIVPARDKYNEEHPDDYDWGKNPLEEVVNGRDYADLDEESRIEVQKILSSKCLNSQRNEDETISVEKDEETLITMEVTEEEETIEIEIDQESIEMINESIKERKTKDFEQLAMDITLEDNPKAIKDDIMETITKYDESDQDSDEHQPLSEEMIALMNRHFRNNVLGEDTITTHNGKEIPITANIDEVVPIDENTTVHLEADVHVTVSKKDDTPEDLKMFLGDFEGVEYEE